MPEPVLHAALRDSVTEVLEKMFFVPAMEETPPEGAGVMPCEGQLAVEVAFEGQPSGRLVLCVSPCTARSIAADFLGEEADAMPEPKIGEVVRELANMVCGSVLSRVESATTFRLAAPRTLAAPPEAPFDEGATVYAVNLSDGVLTAMVTTERPACRERLEPVS